MLFHAYIQQQPDLKVPPAMARTPICAHARMGADKEVAPSSATSKPSPCGIPVRAVGAKRSTMGRHESSRMLQSDRQRREQRRRTTKAYAVSQWLSGDE